MRRRPTLPYIPIVSGIAAALLILVLLMADGAHAIEQSPDSSAALLLPVTSSVDGFELRINTGGQETIDADGNQ